MAKVVLYNHMLHRAGEEFLRTQVDVQLVGSESTHAEVYDALSDADGLIVRLPGNVDGKMIEHAPKLKVISSAGTGTDHIDIQTATKFGIAVVNNAGIGALPVAEHAVGMMLSIAKKITKSDRKMRQIGWDGREAFFNEDIGYELTNKTVGIIGMGFIGQKVGEICRLGFQNNVIGYDPIVSDQVFESNQITRYENLEELCKDADFISIHAPYNAKTHHLINEFMLNQMKPTAFLINCARGGVVDNEALYKALKENRIAGAGVDVFDPEPPQKNDKLFSLDNIIVTPHIAGITEETARKLSLNAAKQVLQVLKGEKPASLINDHIWEKIRM